MKSENNHISEQALDEQINRFRFWNGVFGEPDTVPGTETRSRWVVGEALRQVASMEKSPEIRRRLIWAAGRAENGSPISKKVLRSISRDTWAKVQKAFCEKCRALVPE